MSNPEATSDLGAGGRWFVETPKVKALIDARVALTGRPREVYETYLTRPPRPGQTWEDALYGRMSSLAAGPLPALVAEQLRRQVQATSRSAQAA